MRQAYTVLVIAVTVIVGAGGAYALGGVGGAQAAVSGGTDVQQTTIEGAHPSGYPDEIVMSVSGSYEWANMDAYDAQVTVYASDSVDEDAAIAHEEYNLDQLDAGVSSTTFSNVSGDLLSVSAESGYDDLAFAQPDDGESRTESAYVTVRVNVCEYDLEHGGECAAFTETHNVTVTIHNEPDNSTGNGGAEPPANVSGSTAVSGTIAFAGDEDTDDPPEEVGQAVPTPAETPVGCADGSC